MRVAVVGGTAGIGYGIALRLAKAGDEVVIGGRLAEKAERIAGETAALLPEASIAGKANVDAVVDRDLVVVTVPYPGLADTYKGLKEKMAPGTVVLDCNVPLASELGGKATRVLGVWEGSAAQQAKGILGKDFPMASGFHTVMGGKLIKIDEALGADVLICGDAKAKPAAQEVVEKIEGARYVDCGPLETARILESLTALLIGINIRFKLDPGAGLKVTGLPE